MRACKKAVEPAQWQNWSLALRQQLILQKNGIQSAVCEVWLKNRFSVQASPKKIGRAKDMQKNAKKIHNIGLQTFFKVSNYARKINHRNCDFPAINAHWWIFTSEHSRGSTPHPVWEPFAFSQIKKKQKIECDDLNWHYIQEILWLHHPKSKGQQAIWVCWVGCGRGRHQEPFFVLLFSLKKMQLDLLLKKIVK